MFESVDARTGRRLESHPISSLGELKSHLELQRDITLIELVPRLYFFLFKVMDIFAKFDEI